MRCEHERADIEKHECVYERLGGRHGAWSGQRESEDLFDLVSVDASILCALINLHLIG